MSKAILIEKPAGVVQGDMGYFDAAQKFIKVGGSLATGKVPVRQSDGSIQWATPAAGMTNPMTTAEDLIVGGASGAPARKAKGSDGQFLGVVSGALAWANPPSGFANPMTTAGDVIVGGASGVAARLAKGSNNTVLGVDGSGNLGYKADPTGGSGITQAQADAIYRRRGLTNIISPTQDLVNIIASTVSVGVNAGRACRVVVPKDGTLADLYVFIGGSATSPVQKIIGAVYDVGATTSTVRTKVKETAEHTLGALANVWEPLGGFTGGGLAVTAGQVLDLTFVIDNATTTVGRASTANAGQHFPDAFGLTSGCKPKFAYTFAPASFAAPATIAESEALSGSNWFPIIGLYA